MKMDLRKTLAGVAASCALLALLSVPSQAQQTTFASATSIGQAFEYSPGAGISTDGSGFIADYLLSPNAVYTNATLSFTGLSNNGTLISQGGSTYEQLLNGGTFSLTAGGQTLLTGKFTGAALIGTVNSSTGNVRTLFNDVSYTGGTLFTQSGLSNPGAFSFGLTSVTPNFSLTSDGKAFNAFDASGTGSFSGAPVVPEPGTLSLFAIGGLGVLGLVVRTRKRLN